MASVLFLQSSDKKISVVMSNEGTSPIPESVNISMYDGDDITMTPEQMRELYLLLGQAIQADERIRKANPHARG